MPEPPSLDGYIKNGDDVTLNSVSFGDNTKIDTQPDLGLVLQGDYIYGKSDSGYEHFFVESGNFNVKSKKIQKVNDGQAVDDAVNVRQLNVVDGKADEAKSIADEAKSVADGADALSKDNKNRLDNLSPAPDLDGYAKLDTNVQFTKVNIKNDYAGDTENPYFWCDSSNGNTVIAATGSLYLNQYDHDGTKHRWGLVDTTNRLTLDNPTKVSRLMNKTTWTTVSSNDHAAFVRLDLDSRIVLGAKSDVSFQVNGKDVAKVKETGVDFTGLDTNATIEHDQDINVKVGLVDNLTFTQSGMKVMRDVDGNNHTINNMGDLLFNSGYQIEGGTLGDLKIRNVNGIYKNTTTDNNSIRLDGEDLKYKATHHMFFKSQSTDQVFGISDSGANLFNHSLLHVKHVIGDSTGTMDVSGVRTLKRNNAENTKQAVIFNAGDITSYSNKHEWQTNDGARRLTIENHKADWHDCIVGNVKDAVADKDVPNLAQVNALIAASGGGGVEYENYIIRSQDGSKTFYETTSSEKNAWVVATNNNAGTLTYTFDYSRNGQEVVAGLENKTKRTIIVRMQLRQSTSLTVEVPAYSVFTARYVPDIGHYVYNIGTWYPTEQRVITLDDINPQISSDYKQMTKNIIAAMPNHTTLIGYHNPDIDGASKYKFVTTGKTGTGKEGSKCSVVIHKHTSNHAVGLSTTEGSGRVYSRVLDGTTGIWNTNDTSASFSLQEDIPLDEIPED